MAQSLMTAEDQKFMTRALRLARNGEGRVAPNPMVGAVVVADGRIIGEGYHAKFGEEHAEVNAIKSIKDEDRHLLKDAKLYVTLEPCSHFGKTPPCAQLIIDCGIQEVAIGSLDPNPLVAGKGIKLLEEAGIKVEKGLMEKECLDLNRRFMTAKTLKRPWILLKWAQSHDGFMAAIDKEGNPYGIKFSNPLSSVWMHRERANVEAIMVGRNTQIIDKPRLDVRFWYGKNPIRIDAKNHIELSELMTELNQKGIDSLMVEGGPTLLKSFLDAGLYDELRIETSPNNVGNGLRAPDLPDRLKMISTEICRGNVITTYRR